MATYRARFADPDIAERRKVVLFALRRGKETSALATLLGTSAHVVEDFLIVLRDEGLVRCTNKVWYRKDLELKPAKPRKPRKPTPKVEKFLARQGKLFGE